MTFGHPDWFPCFGIQVSGFKKRFQAKYGRFSTMVLTTLFSSPFSRLNLWPTSVLTYDRPLSLLKTALSHQLAFVLNHAAKIQLFSPRRAVSPKSETAFPWERDVWGERWGLRTLISPFVLSVFSFGLPSLTFDNPSTAPSRFDRDTQSRSKPLPPRGVQEQLATRKSANCWFSQKLR